jgi:hypothetical protein
MDGDGLAYWAKRITDRGGLKRHPTCAFFK